MDKTNMEILIANNSKLLESVEQIGKKLANIEGKLDSNIKRLDENIARLKAFVDVRLEAIDDQINITFKKIQENENLMISKNLAMEEKFKTLETKYIKERVLADLYSKRNNLIIYGLPETDQIEDRSKSLQLVKNFLKAQLKIEQDISIVDAHRQRSSKNKEDRVYTRSTTKSRPLIFKLSNIFDKDVIMTNLKNLKPMDSSIKQKIYVNQHLPAAMVKQKAVLFEKFKQARNDRKRTRWGIDYNTANYCLYIDGAKHIAED